MDGAGLTWSELVTGSSSTRMYRPLATVHISQSRSPESSLESLPGGSSIRTGWVQTRPAQWLISLDSIIWNHKTASHKIGCNWIASTRQLTYRLDSQFLFRQIRLLIQILNLRDRDEETVRDHHDNLRVLLDTDASVVIASH